MSVVEIAVAVVTIISSRGEQIMRFESYDMEICRQNESNVLETISDGLKNHNVDYVIKYKCEKVTL